MLRTIRIQGFKCFQDVELEFRSLNLLAGKNSSGKTTVIQAILVMAQEGLSSFAGSYIDIGSMLELRNRIAGSKEIDIQIDYEQGNEQVTWGKHFSDEKSEIKWGTSFATTRNVVYLSADRIGVEDSYEKSLLGNDQIGIRCEYAFHYLAEHESDAFIETDFIFDKKTKSTFGGQVDYWLDRILGYRVIAEEIPGISRIRVLYGNAELGNELRPKNVGTGVSYVAEVIIAALSCKKGDLLLIENPEIHLHPAGQALFVEFLAFLACQGVQIIMETHSDHIYNGIRRCISTDQIDPEKVAVYYMMLNEQKLGKPVHIEVGADGHVENPQEGLFDQVEKDLDVILGW